MLTPHLRRILRIARRDYVAAVFTKGFIIGLVLAPVMMLAGLIAIPVMQHVETPDRHLLIIDHSHSLRQAITEAALAHNGNTPGTNPGATNPQPRSGPAFHLQFEAPRTNQLEAQRLDLADRVRAGSLHAFVEIDPHVLRPRDESRDARIRYYSKSSVLDETRGWIEQTVNRELRRRRLLEAGLDPVHVASLTGSIPLEALTLPSRDRTTGHVQAARKEDPAASLAIPFAGVILQMLLVMMGCMPLLQGVLEEKSQRIAEVLLGCASPGELMAGKLLGGLAVTLTAMAFYFGSGLLTLAALAKSLPLPLAVLPWFILFSIIAVLMNGALALALGSACSDLKDAQHLQLPVMIPVLVPVILMLPVLKEPNSFFATVFSLIPPFTPLAMVLRLGSPAGTPAWQPWLGLLGSLLWTLATLWLAGRIFRVGLLAQGKTPRLRELLRWGLRG